MSLALRNLGQSSPDLAPLRQSADFVLGHDGLTFEMLIVIPKQRKLIRVVVDHAAQGVEKWRAFFVMIRRRRAQHTPLGNDGNLILHPLFSNA
jgi:hypothetical protein